MDDPRIEADLARITKVARDLLEVIYTVADEEQDDVSVDSLMVILMLDQHEEEGVAEHCVFASESTRHYVKEGILASAVREHDMRMRGQQYDETEDDDE